MIACPNRRRDRAAYRRSRVQRVEQQRGATLVEFALIAPIFFAVVFGLFSVVAYVFEVQVANQSAEAAARWGVAQCNYSSSCNPAASAPRCPAVVPPDGMVNAARAAAGPFAGSLQLTDLGGTGPSYASEAQYCQITVTIPSVSFGRFFGLGPPNVVATAIDYVT